MIRIEMKEIHGELFPVKIYPPVSREEVNFIPVKSKTKGFGGKVSAQGWMG